MTRQEFFEALAPHAARARREGSPLFPSIRLAQNLLETGGVIHSWFNLGGIKVGSGKPNEWWDGSSVNRQTWEVYDGVRFDTAANFRAYRSVYDFYKDQDLLLQLPRYDRVRASKTPEEQAAMLQLCGYATDPAYPGKLVAIINQYELKKYDEEDDTLELTNYQWQTLAANIAALVKQGKIDASWQQKAEARTLTQSELAWLTFTLVNR